LYVFLYNRLGRCQAQDAAMVPLQNSVGGGGLVLVEHGEASPGIKMAKSPQKKTPHKTVKDVCQLCDTTFTD